ncbi:hypothetical protein Caka_0942 [Coraliomargarita akajimensis DSM 45221]|uniref:Uncharacterized protein n=1 Tax=Coraliomargarita akajimensis (strain DSM 45221 / IAM 15411 / JCM 23193 / KCTC 12865 / 04OKA010-24) TaxID=583355 RepID=D5EQX1_CORAD|nr:hypothetical protein Caka_0942 [Coraliomargarita akajimensis DSM 45221]
MHARDSTAFGQFLYNFLLRTSLNKLSFQAAESTLLATTLDP